MKLFNTIAIYDVYIIAESAEAARDTLLAAINGTNEQALMPNEVTATESKMERSIRAGYRDERPFVAGDVSDADFDKCKGKTTIQLFEHIYCKRG
jgi:hypothetical protein